MLQYEEGLSLLTTPWRCHRVLQAALADMRKDVIALQDLPPGFSKEALQKVIVLKKKSMLAKVWTTLAAFVVLPVSIILLLLSPSPLRYLFCA